MSSVSIQADGAVEDLVAGYAAGTLPGPLFAMVKAHLDMSPANRAFVSDLEIMSGAELDEIVPEALVGRDSMLARILDMPVDGSDQPAIASTRMPKPIADLVGLDIDDIPWRTVLPGVREYKVGEQDGCNMSMFWLRSGTGVPTHTHGGAEVTLVLQGGYSDGVGHYVAGDLAYADNSVNHRPIADDDGDCIGFAITDAPLVLTGPLGRFFNPLIR